MGQFVCYGGKGGVGKTTCAAATGIALAERGQRTLIVSTDPAHSLSDAFGVEPGPDRRQVAETLWIEEVGPETGERAFRGIVDAIAVELRSAGVRLDEDEIERLFTAGVVPGSDELAALELLAGLVDTREFDRVVVDTAPTGHTLRLLDLPDVLRETVATAMTVRSRVRQFVDAARGAVFGPAYAVFGRDDDETDDLTELRDRMERVGDLLRDPERTEFRVVTVPEPMAVAETRRLVARLWEEGVPVSTLVVNRVATDADTDCERCRARTRTHEASLAQIRDEFSDLDVVALPEVDAEGRDGLNELAELLERD